MPLLNLAGVSLFLLSILFVSPFDALRLTFRQLAQFCISVFFEEFLSFTSFHIHRDLFLQDFCIDAHLRGFTTLQKVPLLLIFTKLANSADCISKFYREIFSYFLS